MFAVLSVVASIALTQAPSEDCRDVRNVRALAKKHRLSDATLHELERRYCMVKVEKKVSLPSPPGSVSGKSEACVEAMLVEQLAGFDTVKEDHDVMKALREKVCRENTAGELRYSTGLLARSSTGVWNFPSGRLARALGRPWLYPDQKLARHENGVWQYPNGGTARYSDGKWKAPKGSAGTIEALYDECRRAGGCKGPRTPTRGGEELYAAWLLREVWTTLEQ